jgi:hypothetical protein
MVPSYPQGSHDPFQAPRMAELLCPSCSSVMPTTHGRLTLSELVKLLVVRADPSISSMHETVDGGSTIYATPLHDAVARFVCLDSPFVPSFDNSNKASHVATISQYFDRGSCYGRHAVLRACPSGTYRPMTSTRLVLNILEQHFLPSDLVHCGCMYHRFTR